MDFGQRGNLDHLRAKRRLPSVAVSYGEKQDDSLEVDYYIYAEGKAELG